MALLLVDPVNGITVATAITVTGLSIGTMGGR